MRIDERRQGAVTVLVPQGPLVKADARQFASRAQEVSAENRGRLVVDTSGMPFVDSEGLEALVELAEAMERGGRTLKVAGVHTTLQEVFRLTGVVDQLDVYEDTATAVRSFI